MNPKIDFENPRCRIQYSGWSYWVSAILVPPSSILKIWPEIRHQRPQKPPYNKFATNQLIFKNFVPDLGSAILNLANLRFMISNLQIHRLPNLVKIGWFSRKTKLEATKKINQGLILKLRASTLECRVRLWKSQYGGSKMRAGSRRKIECPEEKACKNKNSQAIVSFFGSNCSWWTPLIRWYGRSTKFLMDKIQYGGQIF